MEFNSDLKNLLKNYKQQQKYSEYTKASKDDKKNISLWKDIDTNNNEKISYSDKLKMIKDKNEILNNKNLFDVNNDGEFNQTDADMFLKGDVDGDGKITQEELNFVSTYKNDFKKAMVDKKADFTLDGKKYVGGKLASGIINNKYYRNGVLFNGTANGKKYVNGELAQGTISGYLYKDGKKFTGTHTDGKYYKNGKLYSGKTADGTKYNEGVVQTTEETTESTGKKAESKKAESTNTVTSDILAKTCNCEIRTEKTYDKDNNLISDSIRIYQTVGKTAYMIPATDGLDPAKITRVSSNSDGSFTIVADGKSYNCTDFSFKTYDKTTGKHTGDVTRKDGKTVSHITYNNGYTMTYTDYVNEKWTKAESVYNDGCKIEYARTFNEDGSYTRVEKKYNADGEIVEMRTASYDNLDRMITVEEYVGGKYNKNTGKYEGEMYSERTREYKGNSKNYCKCTRTSYTDDTKTVKKEYKEYEFLDEKQTKANVTLTKYNNDGSINNIIKQTCYFGLKDENGLEYRYYLRSDGAIEIWHYNSSGTRTKVTVTNPDGNQTAYTYNNAGQKTSTSSSKVDIQKDIIDKYGKDENGNYLKVLY